MVAFRAVSLDDELVEVVGLGRVERAQREIIEDRMRTSTG